MPMSMPAGKSAVVTDDGTASMSMPAQSQGYTAPGMEPLPAYEGLLQQGPATSLPPSSRQMAPPVGQPELADPSTMQDLHSQSRYQMPAQYTRENPQYRTAYQPPQSTTSTPGLIGPIGYDVEK
jgi:hypothetical protein